MHCVPVRDCKEKDAVGGASGVGVGGGEKGGGGGADNQELE